MIKNILIIVTFLYFCFFISGCKFPSCTDKCSANNTSAQNAIASTAKDGNFTYPAGFYFESSKRTNYLCPCANSITEADILFEYSNTQNARNYPLVSKRETAKYYERTWDYRNGDFMLERVHKCGYFSVSCTAGPPDGYLVTVDQVKAKEFAEYYIMIAELLYPADGITDITGSAIADNGTDYVVTIGFIRYDSASDWCLCSFAYTGESVITINKTSGAVTKTTTFSTDFISTN